MSDALIGRMVEIKTKIKTYAIATAKRIPATIMVLRRPMPSAKMLVTGGKEKSVATIYKVQDRRLNSEADTSI